MRKKNAKRLVLGTCVSAALLFGVSGMRIQAEADSAVIQESAEPAVYSSSVIASGNCGEKGQEPIWYIFVIHEMNRPSDLPYDSYTWLLLTVNARTGEVMEKTLDTTNCEPFVLKPWPFRQ